MVNLAGEKMSKSTKLYFLIEDIAKDFEPELVRFYLSVDALPKPDRVRRRAPERGARRVAAHPPADGALRRLRRSRPRPPPAPRCRPSIDEAETRFTEAMNDDANTARAIGYLFDLAREVNRAGESGDAPRRRPARRRCGKLGSWIGLFWTQAAEEESEWPAEVLDLVARREGRPQGPQLQGSRRVARPAQGTRRGRRGRRPGTAHQGECVGEVTLDPGRASAVLKANKSVALRNAAGSSLSCICKRPLRDECAIPVPNGASFHRRSQAAARFLPRREKHMSLYRRVARIGLLALLLNAGLVLVPGGDRIGTALATGVVSADPSRSDIPPTAGDPDGPTGDITPPTSGSIDDPTAPIKRPVTRYSVWDAISTVLQLWLRYSFVR
jgi:hypothetical protein